MTVEEEKALRDFLLDIDCLNKLNKWSKQFNLFDVLKVSDTEIRHSNILAWLLDPNENHGLGDSFTKSFILSVIEKNNLKCNKIISLLLQDYYSYQVYREMHHMDIVLVSYEEKTAFIIENKIWSSESNNQLDRYLKQSKIDFENFKYIFYIFLTPEGYEASDYKNWISFSYEEIIEDLIKSMAEKDIREDVKLLINNYIYIVREKIMKQNDTELIQICNQIYNKHKMALRLIYDNVEINNSLDSEIITSTLKEISEDGKIIYNEGSGWHFFTKDMNTYLPELEKDNSSYDAKFVYYYFFEKYNDFLVIHFELGGWNLNELQKERMNKIITFCKKNQGEFRYKRCFFNKIAIQQDHYEESLKNAVIQLVDSALKFEENLLRKME